MALIDIGTAKQHLKADGSHEDSLISIYLSAASSSAVEFLNRQIFESQAALDAAVANGTAGELPMLINDQVRAGILLTLSYLYANRGDVDEKMPAAAQSMLWPFRVKMGV